jgi:hypothetical protein
MSECVCACVCVCVCVHQIPCGHGCTGVLFRRNPTSYPCPCTHALCRHQTTYDIRPPCSPSLLPPQPFVPFIDSSESESGGGGAGGGGFTSLSPLIAALKNVKIMHAAEGAFDGAVFVLLAHLSKLVEALLKPPTIQHHV